jgi:hypothetical protein
MSTSVVMVGMMGRILNAVITRGWILLESYEGQEQKSAIHSSLPSLGFSDFPKAAQSRQTCRTRAKR